MITSHFITWWRISIIKWHVWITRDLTWRVSLVINHVNCQQSTCMLPSTIERTTFFLHKTSNITSAWIYHLGMENLVLFSLWLLFVYIPTYNALISSRAYLISSFKLNRFYFCCNFILPLSFNRLSSRLNSEPLKIAKKHDAI